MKEINPSNVGSPWTLEEEVRLYEETGREMLVAAIAATHGRTTGAASVGSVGDSYENALAETINGLYKAVEYAPLEWVDWFNNRRLLAPIGNIPPAEAEDLYYAMLDDVSMAA